MWGIFFTFLLKGRENIDLNNLTFISRIIDLNVTICRRFSISIFDFLPAAALKKDRFCESMSSQDMGLWLPDEVIALCIVFVPYHLESPLP